MSHLNTSNPDADYDYNFEYSPKEYRKLWLRKTFWLLAGMLSVASWFFLLTAMANQGNFVGAVASLILGLGVWLVVMKSNWAHVAFSPINARRKYIRDAYRFAVHFNTVENINWSDQVPFHINVQMLNQTTKVMRLTVEPRSRGLVPNVFEISPTRVSTVHGPDFRDIFSDLKQMLAQTDKFDHFNELVEHVNGAFRPVSNVSQEVRFQAPNPADKTERDFPVGSIGKNVVRLNDSGPLANRTPTGLDGD